MSATSYDLFLHPYIILQYVKKEKFGRKGKVCSYLLFFRVKTKTASTRIVMKPLKFVLNNHCKNAYDTDIPSNVFHMFSFLTIQIRKTKGSKATVCVLIWKISCCHLVLQYNTFQDESKQQKRKVLYSFIDYISSSYYYITVFSCNWLFRCTLSVGW